jgi:hypothetical protein
MVPIRHFVILSLQFFGCLVLTGALVIGFAFNYSYLGGNHQDRAEMNATIGQLLHSSGSVRFDP